MSDMATEITPDVGAEPTSEPTQWSPSREEWESLQSGIGYLAAQTQAREQAAQDEYASDQQRAYQAALEDAFDPYSEDYDPERAMKMVAELMQAQLAPVQQQLDERQYQDALADAEDLAYDTLDDLGVSEDQQDEVIAAATELLTERATELVLGQHGVTIEQVIDALQSPNPAARQWGEEWAAWATEAANQLMNGKREAGLIALQEAAAAVQQASETENFLAQGGSLADLHFGHGRPSVGQDAQGDYSGGQTLSGRMFGGS